MVNRLGLRGGELFAYALVYQFSQSNAGVYAGGVPFLAEWLGCSQPSARKYLHAIEEKGLVKAWDGVLNGSPCRYYKAEEIQTLKDFEGIPQESCESTPKNFEGNPKEFCGSTLKNFEGEYNIDTKIDNKRDNNIKAKAFDFRNALVGIGVSEETADAWLQVRKAKKAVNTELAFNEIHNEITKSGYAPEDCIRTAAVNSWRGFKADWMRNAQEERKENVAPKRKESTFEKNLRTIDRMFGTDYHQNYYGNGNRND